MKRLSLAVALLLASCGAAVGQESKPSGAAPAKVASPETAVLKAGDPAPALSIEKWVKGEAVTGFEAGRTYVVEFWATWCGPCIASMPHLSELQSHYKKDGLTIIGVTSKDPNNTLEAVEKMVADKGDGMGYTVAWDNNRTTSTAFMTAAKQSGIPCSFVVDKAGKIAYIGHPMFLDLVLPDVISGSWDSKTGAERVKKAEKDMSGLYRKMASDPAEALTAIEAFEKEYPTLTSLSTNLKYTAQLRAGDAGAYKTGEKLMAKHIAAKNAEGLNELAWTIVDPDGEVKNKNVDFALKAAQEAATLTGDKDPAILDTLARCWFMKGDKAKAIEIQTKAVSFAKGGMKSQLEEVLAEYKAAK